MDWFRKFSVLFGLGLLVASMFSAALAGQYRSDIYAYLLFAAIWAMILVPTLLPEKPRDSAVFWGWMLHAIAVITLGLALLPWNTQAGWTWANWTWRLVLLLLAPLPVLLARWVGRQ